MSYTKKVGSKRCMKFFEDWYGLNKTTPDKWFDRWEQFIVPLMEEIGYQCIYSENIEKPRGKSWTKEIKFTHPHLETTILLLSRNRRQEGGKIHFVYGIVHEVFIDTTSQTNHGSGSYSVMSRQKVGDEILHHVREGWSKCKDVNQES